jgi:hypothetical protein
MYEYFEYRKLQPLFSISSDIRHIQDLYLYLYSEYILGIYI